MAGPDKIEIEQDSRTLRGSDTLRVSAGVPGQGGWRVVPHVEGVVTFDERVTFSALEAMDGAEVRVELAGGVQHAFSEAVVMRQEATARPNTYSLWVECYGTAS